MSVCYMMEKEYVFWETVLSVCVHMQFLSSLIESLKSEFF